MNDSVQFSVAIPTYFSSEHITECIESFINNKQVDEIVINDDGSSEKEYKNLNRKIIKLNKKLTFDIKISKNLKNLGGFKNKYLTISKCTNENIYQIDSDNYLNNDSKEFFKDFDFNFSKNHLILPGKVKTVFEKQKYFKKNRSYNNVTISEKDINLNLIDIKKLLFKGKNSSIPLNEGIGIKWLLNLGNPITNKNFYLNYLAEGFNSKTVPLEACSIALSFYWLQNGGELKILKNMSHYHRIHQNSYYIREGENAKNSVKYFQSKILDL